MPCLIPKSDPITEADLPMMPMKMGNSSFPFWMGISWRLFRFREAILNREGKFKIICYPEQLPFLRKYMGNLAMFSTVTMENAERVLEVKRKSLL